LSTQLSERITSRGELNNLKIALLKPAARQAPIKKSHEREPAARNELGTHFHGSAFEISKLEIFNKIQDKGNYDAEIHKSAIILPFNFFYKISVLL